MSSLFPPFVQLIRVTLWHNGLLELNGSLLASFGRSLQSLDCSYQPLQALQHGNFVALSHHLSQLSLRYNAIERLEGKTFAHLRKLVQLLLTGNRLTQLHADAFEDLVKLQLLDLSANGIGDVAAGTFANLIWLNLLNLHANRLQTVRAQAFNRLTQLNELRLSNNSISSYEPGAFALLSGRQFEVESLPPVRSNFELYLFNNPITGQRNLDAEISREIDPCQCVTNTAIRLFQ